ncbi:MAPEG family protein [Thalassomonas actiniarum]|uniref:MAPEG family protein n=1 Tax=Thalassomonas actiniarum TaxID=485447 RepID=A0AAE9YTG8_9GAMM|nr:MAPEG family protein [Thalassomonas actiniarum]WDE00896.1 MAPEG family protein [Thalassomonas actiniarum]
MSFSFAITGFYAGLLTLLLIVHSVNVIRMRLKFKVGLGEGAEDQRPLIKAVRIHGNFVEYIPLSLLLMAAYEIAGGNAQLLHALGAVLVIGRIFHAMGLNKSIGTSRERQIGMLATFIVMLVLAVENIRLFLV